MKEKTSTVATFSDLDKAQEVKQRLNQAGIPAEVHDETKLQRFWFVSKPLAGDKVVVTEQDFERAREVLKAEDAKDHVLQGEVRCPQCESGGDRVSAVYAQIHDDDAGGGVVFPACD